MIIRPFEDADIAGLTAIYNHVVETSTAIFMDAPVTQANRAEWISARRDQGYPVLVAIDDKGVAGFASFGDFRSFPGYRFTVEHSVHVRDDARGRGIGQRLMEALIPLARAKGKHILIAGIDADNEGSIRFHQKLGFDETARMPEVGFKFGRRLNLVFMQRCL